MSGIDLFNHLDITKPTYSAAFQSSAVNFDFQFSDHQDDVDTVSSAFNTQEDILFLTLNYGSAGTLAFTYFESDDGNTWAAITTDTTKWRRKQCHGNSNTYASIHQYLGTKDYFRITITPSGFSAAAPLVYGHLRGNKRLKQLAA
jgi:hypothetical protein